MSAVGSSTTSARSYAFDSLRVNFHTVAVATMWLYGCWMSKQFAIVIVENKVNTEHSTVSHVNKTKLNQT